MRRPYGILKILESLRLHNVKKCPRLWEGRICATHGLAARKPQILGGVRLPSPKYVPFPSTIGQGNRAPPNVKEA